jgi:dethiobiotin synthetase
LLVPINKQAKIIDLIKLFDFPVVLVARSKLGTINHTLLSLEALRSRDIKVAGVVINGEKNPENKKAIEEFGAVNILGEVPLLADFSRDSLLKCFKDNFLAQEFAASSI